MEKTEIADEINNRYTSALARGMADTRIMLLRQLIDESAITSYLPNHNPHEIKVDFNGNK